MIDNEANATHKQSEPALHNDSQAEELSRSLLKFAERDGRASYPQFTAAQGIPT